MHSMTVVDPQSMHFLPELARILPRQEMAGAPAHPPLMSAPPPRLAARGVPPALQPTPAPPRIATVSSAPLARRASGLRNLGRCRGRKRRVDAWFRDRRCLLGVEDVARAVCRQGAQAQFGFVRRFDRPGGHGPRLPALICPTGSSRQSQVLCVMASQRHIGRRSIRRFNYSRAVSADIPAESRSAMS